MKNPVINNVKKDSIATSHLNLLFIIIEHSNAKTTIRANNNPLIAPLKNQQVRSILIN